MSESSSTVSRFPKGLSELFLAGIMIMLLGLTRIYYGGNEGIIVVWKGHLSLTDTLVNLSETLALPREVLITEHPEVLAQLEEMNLINSGNSSDELIYKRRLAKEKSKHNKNNEDKDKSKDPRFSGQSCP
jgi:hypothetical protein